MLSSNVSVQPIHILAVDNDEHNLAYYRALLEAWGHRVSVARSGEECVGSARRLLPDIILLDIHMPGMDGFQTASNISGDEAMRTIPIVMVTGLYGAEDRIKALKAGAVDFLAKPVHPDELKAKIDSLIRLKTYNDDVKRRRDELKAELAGKSGQLEAALDAFARFVPREFLQCLRKKTIAELKLGDQVQQEMAILFSDIRSFTALSEGMTPQENFNFLNSYLKRMNPFIWENGGFIDKYIGDGIMALFPEGSEGAISAAIAMLAYIPVYNAHRANFQYDPIRIGISVHSGSVTLGVIGHERFLQGTVISDTVNLAARLEKLTKVYGVSLIVSSHALFNLSDPNRYTYRFLDKIRLEGKEEASSVYEIFDGDPPAIIERKKKTRGTFEKGVYEYHGGNFRKAFENFRTIRDPAWPDKPVEMYMLRCERSMKLGGIDTSLAV
jgi:two-component system sensor histidine kinase ChiS